MSSLEIACNKLNIGKYIDHDDDIIVTDKGIWCTEFNSDRLCELQKTYSTSSVTYVPNPMLLFKASINKLPNKTILIVHNDNISEWVGKLVPHLTNKGYDLAKLHIKEFDIKTSMNAAKEVSLIIFDSINIDDNPILCVAGGTPFFAFNCEINRSTKHILKMCDLNSLICKATDYTQFKKEFYSVHINSDIISNTMKEVANRAKKIFKWIKSPKLYLIPTPKEGSRPDLLSTSNNALIFEPSSALSRYSEAGGLYFREINSTMKDIILYPWIGYIKIISIEGIKRLVEGKEFKVSSILCKGLFVLTPGVLTILTSLLSHTSISISIVEPYVEPSLDKFNFKLWLSEPKMVLVGSKLTLAYMDKVLVQPTEDIDDGSILVIERTDTIITDLLWCIVRKIPVVVNRIPESVAVLGRQYPLYSEGLLPEDVIRLCAQEGIISKALEYIETIKYHTPESFYNSLSR